MLKYRELDWKLICTVLALCLIGIMLIMSAQYHVDSEGERTYFKRQLVWLLLSLVLFAIIIHLPFRLFDATAYLTYAISIILLLLVLFVGRSGGGPARWFNFGMINLAPSDVAKLAIVLALSRFLAYSKLQATSKRRLGISALLAIVPVMLILKQPDLGTSLVFPVILLIMWFWSGLSHWYLLLILSPIVSLIAAFHPISWAIYLVLLLIFLFIVRPGVPFGIVSMVANLASGIVMPIAWGRLATYQQMRILTFIDPGRDPRGAGYQIIQSKISVGSGGLFGKGFLGGSQTRLDFLPERHTDFIFSVLGEEFGLVGSLLVLLLFSYLFYRAIRIAVKCRSRFASLVVMGATSIILFQFIVNVGMTLGFMPVTGLALPFLSYGGTSLMLSWGLVGLIVSAGYRWQDY